jgi:hypothetical protein
MAVRFDAATDRYEATTGLPTGTVYTVVCWFYMSVDRDAYSLLWELQYSGRVNYQSVYLTGSKVIELWNDGVVKMSYQASAVGWQRIALAVGTGGNATLYYGTATGPLATVSTTALTTPAAPDKLLIGNDPFDQWFNGREAPYKMWSATFGPEEIGREFESYQPAQTAGLLRYHPFVNAELVDYSGNGNNLTAGSTATTTEDGPPIPWAPARPRLIHVPDTGTIPDTGTGDPPVYLRRVAPARR